MVTAVQIPSPNAYIDYRAEPTSINASAEHVITIEPQPSLVRNGPSEYKDRSEHNLAVRTLSLFNT
jgi:hypothetical protein